MSFNSQAVQAVQTTACPALLELLHELSDMHHAWRMASSQSSWSCSALSHFCTSLLIPFTKQAQVKGRCQPSLPYTPPGCGKFWIVSTRALQQWATHCPPLLLCVPADTDAGLHAVAAGSHSETTWMSKHISIPFLVRLLRKDSELVHVGRMQTLLLPQAGWSTSWAITADLPAGLGHLGH